MKTRTFVIAIEDRAMAIADEIAYKRQREYTNWLGSIDRYKLRQIIADAVAAAMKAERESRPE